MSEEKRKQVSDQCRVVAYLCETIGKVMADKAKIIECGCMDSLLDLSGDETANLMETLGDIANGMDIVMPEDKWTYPIYEKAQAMFPQ